MHSTILELEIIQAKIHCEPFSELITYTKGLKYPIVHLVVCKVMAVFAVLVKKELIRQVICRNNYWLHTQFMLGAQSQC